MLAPKPDLLDAGGDQFLFLFLESEKTCKNMQFLASRFGDYWILFWLKREKNLLHIASPPIWNAISDSGGHWEKINDMIEWYLTTISAIASIESGPPISRLTLISTHNLWHHQSAWVIYILYFIKLSHGQSERIWRMKWSHFKCIIIENEVEKHTYTHFEWHRENQEWKIIYTFFYLGKP